MREGQISLNSVGYEKIHVPLLIDFGLCLHPA